MHPLLTVWRSITHPSKGTTESKRKLVDLEPLIVAWRAFVHLGRRAEKQNLNAEAGKMYARADEQARRIAAIHEHIDTQSD